MRLILRLFADCPDGETSLALAAALQEALAGFHGQLEGAPERYWKIPQWLEFTFNLAPATSEQFEAFLALHPDGWRHDGEALERSSVWNPPADLHGPTGPGTAHSGTSRPDAKGPGAKAAGSALADPAPLHFLHASLRWAELILTPSGQAPDDPAALPPGPP